MSIIRPSGQRLVLLSCVLAVVPLLLGQGCPGLETSRGVPTVSLQSPNLDQSVAVGAKVTMVYDAPDATSVRAFYDHDGRSGSGDEVTFASNLSAGTSQVVQLATASLPTGRYYLGVTATNSSGTTTAYATGRITVVGSTAITFLSPATDLNVGPGVVVPIRFDAGLTDFSYRVFYDRDATFDGNEVTIAQSSSGGTSLIEKSFDTSALTTGTYNIGVTVTTSVGSVVTEYATGRVIVVTGVYVQVLAPTIGLQTSVGSAVQVVVAANDPANTSTPVRIFYDPDNTFGNGNETTINVMTASAGGTVWNTTGVAEGQYYIGAQLQNGQTPAVVSYSAGPVQLGASTGTSGTGTGGTTGTFLLSAPSADVRMYAGAETEIRWFADDTLSTGTVALYRVSDVNNTGVYDSTATQTQIVAGLSPAARKYTLSTTGLTGAFFIVGKLTAADATVYVKASKGRLIVRPPMYWMGGLNQASGFAGCALQGFNFQDLAGSGFLAAGDVDLDGLDDFVVLSQFAKPRLINPGGVGSGEGYLIYGNRARLTGSYDLNRTGSKPKAALSTATATDGIDQGVIFAGVPPRGGSDKTAGIMSATVAGDLDADGKPELAFGMPKVDSYSLWGQPTSITFEGMLENDGHFLRGGVVIVSSTNPVLQDRSTVRADGTRVIRLQQVGQRFEVQFCNANYYDCKGTCLGQPCLNQLMIDRFKDDNDNTCNGYDYAGWWLNFWAPPLIDPQLAYHWPFCPVGFAPQLTGMLIPPPLEPFGARILGQCPEDGSEPDQRFGSVLSSVPNGQLGAGTLMIAAPNYSVNTVAWRSPEDYDILELGLNARPNAGAVYILPPANFWDKNDSSSIRGTPKPCQYIIKTVGFSCFPPDAPAGSGEEVMSRPFYIVGPAANTNINNVTSIPDFNGDALADFMVGSSNEGATNEGAVYIIYRRQVSVEGNYLLEELALPPTDPERLNGIMIHGEAGDKIGDAISGGGDFNGDGKPDVLIGLPNHRGGRGAVLIVFSRQNLVSPAGGFSIDDVVAQGYGALLVGANVGDLAGFNVTNVGDMDGDGKDDLLVSSPAASPMFDSNGDGVKDAIGLDMNGDGVADDLTNSGQSTDLTHAGLVYLIKGSNTLVGEISLSLLGTKDLQGYAFVGKARDDNLGGGSLTQGAYAIARSRGLSYVGDVDGDGKKDLLVSSILASPGGKTHAGECYLIYGGIQP